MIKKSFLLGILIAIYVQVDGHQKGQNITYSEKRYPPLKTILEDPVSVIHQDEQGVMWFASNKNLGRFDGLFLKNFLEKTDSSLMELGSIMGIIDLGKDNFCINMVKGILLFDYKTGRYETLITIKEIQQVLQTDQTPVIHKIFLDNQFIWIGTNIGLIQFDNGKRQMTGIYRIFKDLRGDLNNIHDVVPAGADLLCVSTGYSAHLFSKNTHEFSDDILDDHIKRKYRDLCLDHDASGKLWIGYGGNIYTYSINSKTLSLEIENLAETVTDKTPEGNIFNVDSIFWNSAITISKIIVQDDRKLLISLKKYLILYDRVKGTLNSIFSTSDKTSRKVDNILDVYITSEDEIWVSTYNSEIYYLSPNKYSVQFLRNVIEGYDDIFGSMYNIDVFDNGEVWAGRGKGKGLVRLDLNKKTLDEYPADGLQYEITRRMVKDPSGKIWAIADGGIIYSLDPVKSEYRYLNCPQPDQWFFSLIMDDYGNLWAGGAGGGLVKLNKATGKCQVFDASYSNSNGYQLNPVWQILKLKNRELLIFGSQEVVQLKITTKTANDGTVYYNHDFSNYLGAKIDEIYPNVPQSKFITGFIDSDQNLWMGTDGAGVIKYSKLKNEYKYYNISNGMPSNVVKSILEDNYGYIWMATDKGFSRLNPDEETLDNIFYWKDSEYPDKQTDWWDGHKDNQGILYYGILGDPIIIDPANFLDWKAPKKKVFFSDLKINNRPQRPLIDQTISRLVNYQPDIYMDYTHHIFSLDYTVLDYKYAGKYRYRYKLEGFDQGWIEAGYNSNITYSNLPSGKYRLVINVSDSNQFFDENVAALNIYKAPAPWNTWWAWSGYFLLVCVLVYILVILVIKRKQIQRRLKKEHLELEKIKEIEEAKSRFFTQISHEIRTPLSLILQPVENLIHSETSGDESVLYEIIRRNALRLKDLLNQMLDLSRLNSGRLKVRAARKDIVEFIRLSVANFESLANSKGLTLEFQSHRNNLDVYFDSDKIEKVINNLLSNAIKFSPTGGKIRVEVWYPGEDNEPDLMNLMELERNHTLFKEAVVITVKDSGIGIAEEHLDKIFDRFFQVDNGQEYEGLGIGLSLIRELVDLHHGKVMVKSKPGKGSMFCVILPLDKTHFKEDQLKEDILEEQPTELLRDTKKIEDNTQESRKRDKPIILYIEDNEDLLKYLKHTLESDFTFVGARNGNQGLITARELIPDLIISDVMMPGLDGREVCRRLKKDYITCHIPVIMLTARARKEDCLEGLETGADDYIIKPFEIRELKLRIRNQLNHLERLRERYNRTFLFDDPDVIITSRDNAFLSQITDVVKVYMEDPSFSVSDLSSKMAISRSLLYRKVKALTGKQPNQFIRMIRLKKAAELLAGNSGNISEVAYAVGFNNISYFSRCFHAMYQMTPSKYAKSRSGFEQEMTF